jgi:hypothetical protein
MILKILCISIPMQIVSVTNQALRVEHILIGIVTPIVTVCHALLSVTYRRRGRSCPSRTAAGGAPVFILVTVPPRCPLRP